MVLSPKSPRGGVKRSGQLGALFRYFAAAIFVGAGIAVRLLLDPWVGDRFPYATVLGAVLVSAWYGGLGPALFAVVVGGFAADYFVIQPRGEFRSFASSEIVGLLLYFVSGSGIALLGGAMHGARRRSEKDASELRSLNRELEARVSVRTRELEEGLDSVRDAEARAGGIVNSAMDAIISIGADQRIVLFNRAAEEMFQCQAADALGSSIDRFLPERYRQHHREQVEVFGRTGVTSRSMKSPGEVFGLRSNGEEFPIEASISQLTAGRRKIFTVILRDISERKAAWEERKRAETAVRELNASLEERVRERTKELEFANREMESFCYSVSHDLRAPLRAMDGFSRALLEDYGKNLPAEGRRFAQTILSNAERMGALIDDLLAFSRIGKSAVRTQTVDMNVLVRDALQELLFEPSERVAVDVETLPLCVGDPGLLKQVWINLISNALKFSGKTEKARIEIGADPSEGNITYYIRDNGVGFDPAYTDKLFGVFQRLHGTDDFPGTGVGLAIVHRVVSRLGGSVRAEGAPGKGAKFSFTLKPGALRIMDTQTAMPVGTLIPGRGS